MFSSALVTALKDDATLAALLNTFEGEPAVFSEDAPETVARPSDEEKTLYVVFTIEKFEGGSVAIDRFTVDIDLFDWGTSWINVKAAAKQIEIILDQKKLSHTDFEEIRFFRSFGGRIRGTEAKDKHYNLKFLARAARKGWMETL